MSSTIWLQNERLRDAKDLIVVNVNGEALWPCPQASQDDEDERRWRYACAIAYCDELGYACDMATTEMSREEAAALFDKKLREMHPDEVLKQRLEELEKQEKQESEAKMTNYRRLSDQPAWPCPQTHSRVEHKVSRQRGIVTARGIWYSSVRFDGENATSWIANDSLRVIPEVL